jgi:hypothetical protein
MRTLLIAALLAGSTATAAKAAEPTAAAQPAKAAAKKPGAPKKDDDFDMAQVMAMFDKMFPPQPDPAPQRLALARSTASGVFPAGTYAALFEEMLGGLTDRFLSMNPADFASKDSKPGSATTTSMRDAMAKGDPHFDERMRIARRVIGEELVKISALMEPKLREGLARSLARRFDERQLADINSFLATDSGRAFGAQTMKMWIDPDVMGSMFQTFPDMMTAVPGAVQRLEAETAHLPKPKPEAEPKLKAKRKSSARP